MALVPAEVDPGIAFALVRAVARSVAALQAAPPAAVAASAPQTTALALQAAALAVTQPGPAPLDMQLRAALADIVDAVFPEVGGFLLFVSNC